MHTHRSVAPSFRDRFTRLFFDVRTLGREREPDLPIQQPQLSEWPPLHIEKRQCCQHCRCHDPKKKRKHIVFRWVLLIIVIYLLINAIVLDARTLHPSTSSSPSPASTSTSTTLSTSAQQCLSQYIINAPSTPTLYPCSTCFPIFQSVPSNFSDGNPGDAEQIQNALQFCSLRSIFDTTDSAGQSLLANGSWVQNVQFCAWTGVSCDGSGRVSSLQLTFPSVPAALPSEIGGLTGLQSLQITGDTTTPAGSLPSSFTSLTALSTLNFESTAISALPDNLFSSLKKVTTITLVRNRNMGSVLPSSVTGLSLQNLVVNQQSLTNPLSSLFSSSFIRSSIQLIDLSSTSLSGSIPSSISSLSSLVELHLDNNNLTNPIPATFPPKLQLLTLSNNTGLTGSVTGSFCSLTALQECSMTGTGLTPKGGCSVCQFS
ncbi:hypothetical protein BKA93DRAFT_731519 [Sparassis latifolia]